jgi:septum formation inhibitor-activating ATPase MinD
MFLRYHIKLSQLLSYQTEDKAKISMEEMQKVQSDLYIAEFLFIQYKSSANFQPHGE